MTTQTAPLKKAMNKTNRTSLQLRPSIMDGLPDLRTITTKRCELGYSVLADGKPTAYTIVNAEAVGCEERGWHIQFNGEWSWTFETKWACMEWMKVLPHFEA